MQIRKNAIPEGPFERTQTHTHTQIGENQKIDKDLPKK